MPLFGDEAPDFQEPTQTPKEQPKQNEQPVSFDEAVDMTEQAAKLPKGWLRALRLTESPEGHYRADGSVSTSPTGARGGFQFTGRTAKSYGINRDDPVDNAIGAAKFANDNFKALRPLTVDDETAWTAAAIAHNRGLDAVKKMIHDGKLVPEGSDGYTESGAYANRFLDNLIKVRGGSTQSTAEAQQTQEPVSQVEAPQTTAPLSQSAVDGAEGLKVVNPQTSEMPAGAPGEAGLDIARSPQEEYALTRNQIQTSLNSAKPFNTAEAISTGVHGKTIPLKIDDTLLKLDNAALSNLINYRGLKQIAKQRGLPEADAEAWAQETAQKYPGIHSVGSNGPAGDYMLQAIREFKSAPYKIDNEEIAKSLEDRASKSGLEIDGKVYTPEQARRIEMFVRDTQKDSGAVRGAGEAAGEGLGSLYGALGGTAQLAGDLADKAAMGIPEQLGVNLGDNSVAKSLYDEGDTYSTAADILRKGHPEEEREDGKRTNSWAPFFRDVTSTIPSAIKLAATMPLGPAQLPFLGYVEGRRQGKGSALKGAAIGAANQLALGTFAKVFEPISGAGDAITKNAAEWASASPAVRNTIAKLAEGVGFTAALTGQGVLEGQDLTSSLIQNTPFGALPLLHAGKGETALLGKVQEVTDSEGNTKYAGFVVDANGIRHEELPADSPLIKAWQKSGKEPVKLTSEEYAGLQKLQSRIDGESQTRNVTPSQTEKDISDYQQSQQLQVPQKYQQAPAPTGPTPKLEGPMESEKVVSSSDNRTTPSDVQTQTGVNVRVTAGEPVVSEKGSKQGASLVDQFVQEQSNGQRQGINIGNASVPEELSKKFADWFDSAKHEPDSPEVKKSYKALNDEVSKQYQFLLDKGYTFEPWTGEGEPYKNSAEMRNDLEKNKHLFYFKTDNGFGEGQDTTGHPMLEQSEFKDSEGKPMLKNDVFRVVHDSFAHFPSGAEFGPRGEWNATRAHAAALSDEALPALLTETQGQNSWVNAGPHLRDAEGNVPKKGEPGYVSPMERPFAAQKAVLPPKELVDSWKKHNSENQKSASVVTRTENTPSDRTVSYSGEFSKQENKAKSETLKKKEASQQGYQTRVTLKDGKRGEEFVVTKKEKVGGATRYTIVDEKTGNQRFVSGREIAGKKVVLTGEAKRPTQFESPEGRQDTEQRERVTLVGEEKTKPGVRTIPVEGVNVKVGEFRDKAYQRLQQAVGDTLQALRRMKSSGELSQNEYDDRVNQINDKFENFKAAIVSREAIDEEKAKSATWLSETYTKITKQFPGNKVEKNTTFGDEGPTKLPIKQFQAVELPNGKTGTVLGSAGAGKVRVRLDAPNARTGQHTEAVINKSSLKVVDVRDRQTNANSVSMTEGKGREVDLPKAEVKPAEKVKASKPAKESKAETKPKAPVVLDSEGNKLPKNKRFVETASGEVFPVTRKFGSSVEVTDADGNKRNFRLADSDEKGTHYIDDERAASLGQQHPNLAQGAAAAPAETVRELTGLPEVVKDNAEKLSNKREAGSVTDNGVVWASPRALEVLQDAGASGDYYGITLTPKQIGKALDYLDAGAKKGQPGFAELAANIRESNKTYPFVPVVYHLESRTNDELNSTAAHERLHGIYTRIAGAELSSVMPEAQWKALKNSPEVSAFRKAMETGSGRILDNYLSMDMPVLATEIISHYGGGDWSNLGGMPEDTLRDAYVRVLQDITDNNPKMKIAELRDAILHPQAQEILDGFIKARQEGAGVSEGEPSQALADTENAGAGGFEGTPEEARRRALAAKAGNQDGLGEQLAQGEKPLSFFARKGDKPEDTLIRSLEGIMEKSQRESLAKHEAEVREITGGSNYEFVENYELELPSQFKSWPPEFLPAEGYRFRFIDGPLKGQEMSIEKLGKGGRSVQQLIEGEAARLTSMHEYDEANKLTLVQKRQTETPEFKKWFGDSKVVDDEGEPLVVYHGTDEKFDTFDTELPGQRSTNLGNSWTVNTGGIFLSESSKEAEEYGPKSMPLYAKLEKPLADPDTYRFSGKRLEDAKYIFEPLVQTEEWVSGDRQQPAKQKYVSLGTKSVEVSRVEFGGKEPELLPDWPEKLLAGGYGINWNTLDNPEVAKRMKERGYDGTYVNEPDLESGRSIFVINPNQVKSATSNSGAFDSSDPNILAHAAYKNLDPVSIYQLPIGEERKQNRKIEDVAEELAAKTKKHLGVLGPDASEKKMSNRGLALIEGEMKYLLAQEQSGKDIGRSWFKDDVSKMEQGIEKLYPETKNKAMMSLFKTVVAYTSGAAKPNENLALASELWESTKGLTEPLPPRKANGEKWGLRPQVTAIATERIRNLIAEKGVEGTAKWLTEEHPVSELRKWNTIPGKATDMKPGLMVFGPKYGQFGMNLHGHSTGVTVDMWMMRAWRRYMGDFGSMSKIQTGSLSEAPGMVERRLIQSSIQKVSDDIAKETGNNLTPSETQAALWYYEQELWRQHGAKNQSQSYASAIGKLLAKKAGRLTEAGRENEAAGQDALAGRVRQGDGQGTAAVQESKEIENYKFPTGVEPKGFLYHTTELDNLSSISRDGLKGEDGVTLAHDTRSAEFWKNEAQQKNPVLLRVAKSKLGKVETLYGGEAGASIYEKGVIPSSKLEVYKNGKWEPVQQKEITKQSLQKEISAIDWSKRVDKVVTGTYKGEEDYYQKFKDTGISDTLCTGYACEISKLYPGRTRLFGFNSEDNNKSAIAHDFGGHDFAVLDNRFIVDPWIPEITNGEYGKRSVFDLNDKRDNAIVNRLYGPRESWGEPNSALEKAHNLPVAGKEGETFDGILAQGEKKPAEQSPEEYAKYLEGLPEAKRENIPFNENYDGYLLYESRKLLPKGDKFKKLTDSNSMIVGQDADYLANVKGEPYLLTKQEDPDSPDEFPKTFVWSFESPGGKRVDTTTSDVDEVRQLMEKHLEESQQGETLAHGSKVKSVQDDENKKLASFDRDTWLDRVIDKNPNKTLSVSAQADFDGKISTAQRTLNRMNAAPARDKHLYEKELRKNTKALLSFYHNQNPAGLARTFVEAKRAAFLVGLDVTTRHSLSTGLYNAMEGLSSFGENGVDWVRYASDKIRGKQAQHYSAGLNSIVPSQLYGIRKGIRGVFSAVKEGVQSDATKLINEGGVDDKVYSRFGGSKNPLAAFANGVYAFKGMQDKPMRDYARARSIYELNAIAARNLPAGVNKRAAFRAMMQTPSPRVLDLAERMAADAVFQSPNKTGSAVRQAFKAKNFLSKGADIAVRWEVPFTSTPANILNKTLDYIGVRPVYHTMRGKFGEKLDYELAVKKTGNSLDEQTKRAVNRAFGKGLVGWGLMALGMGLYKSGHATPWTDDKTDIPENNTEELNGTGPGKIKIGNVWVDGRYLGPAGSLVLIGATIAHGVDKRKELRTSDVLKTIGHVVTEEAPAMRPATELLNDNSRSILSRVVQPDSFVPPLSKEIAIAQDRKSPFSMEGPARSQTGDTEVERSINAVKAKLPKTPLNPNFNRQSLPERKDAFGTTINQPNPLYGMPLAKDRGAEDNGARGELMKHGVGIQESAVKKNLSGEDAETRADLMKRREAEGKSAAGYLREGVTAPDYKGNEEESLKNLYSEGKAANQKLTPAEVKSNARLIVKAVEVEKQTKDLLSTRADLTDEQKKEVLGKVKALFSSSKAERTKNLGLPVKTSTEADITGQLYSNKKLLEATINQFILESKSFKP